MIGSALTSRANIAVRPSLVRSDFYDTDGIPDNGDEATNEYHAKKSEWLFLANAYADLGT